MTEPDTSAEARRHAAGLVRSFLLGPLRQLIPAGLNILLYPVIVSKGGLYAVGLWGIFNLFINIFQLGNLGVAQYVSRIISDATSSALRERDTAERVISFWLMCTIALAAVALAFAGPILVAEGIAISAVSVSALLLLFLAGFCSLLYLLFTFMHVSIHQLPYAQVNQVIAAFVQFAIAVVLLQVFPAYLALAAAIAGCYVAQAVGLYGNLRRLGFEAAPRMLRWPSFRFVAALLNNAKGFALLWAAQLLFLIVNRTGVLVFAGTGALGAFEIASRIPFLLEQAFSNGLQPLFAIYAGADWSDMESRRRIARLSQWTYRLLAITSVGCLAAWIALAGPVIGIWLNLADPDMIFATQLFAAFNAVRAFSSPTFWAMQARGKEAWVGMVYMGQAGLFLLLLFLLSRVMTLTFPFIAVLITVLSVGAEMASWILAERKVGFMSLAFPDWRTLAPFAASAVLLTGGFFLAAPVTARAHAVAIGLPHAAGYGLLFVLVLLYLTSGKPLHFLRRPQ